MDFDFSKLKEQGGHLFGLGFGAASIILGIGFCIVFGIFFVFLIILIMLLDSIRVVQFDEYAIRYNKYTQNVPILEKTGDRTDMIFEGGRYVLFGYGNRFITFPRVFQTVDFSGTSQLSSRTSDGLYVSLDISFQYQLEKKNIAMIFEEYGEIYEDLYVKVARDTLRDVVSRYNATEFFDSREEIANDMIDSLKDVLSSFYATVKFVQFKQVDLPDSYESVIEEKEILKQEIEKVEYEKESELIRAQTEVEVARLEADVLITEAHASADSDIIIASAEANATKSILFAETEAFKNMCIDVGFNVTELLTYLWIQSIKEHDQEKLTIQVDKPSQLL